jgi:hypothetical protein
MSTETHNGQGEHDTSEHDGSTHDTAAPIANLSVAADAARAERAQRVARIDQLVAERERINTAIANERAEVERCDSLIAWATKTVRPRGKPKAAQPASNKRR